MQYNALIQALKENRQGWIDLLQDNPDGFQAPERILGINYQLQLVRNLKMQAGDYSEERP